MKKVKTLEGKKKKTSSKKSEPEKIIILETKKGPEEIKKEKIPADEDLEEEVEEDFEISEGFKLASAKKRSIEDIRLGTNLEGALIFAPRIKTGPRGEAKNYAETKYEKNYGENKYGEKTPGIYEEKSAGKESSNGSNSNGSNSNGSNGNP